MSTPAQALRDESRRLSDLRRESPPTWLIVDTLLEHIEALTAHLYKLESALLEAAQAGAKASPYLRLDNTNSAAGATSVKYATQPGPPLTHTKTGAP